MAEFLKGRYEILEVLGRGGEGRVVRALDHQHDRVVALKIRTVHSTADRDDLLAEARVLLNLPAHPALPLLREDFFEGDSYVIVMDFVDGIDLAKLLGQRGRPGLAPSSVLSYLADTADALTHLHTQHPAVIHGDIKPGNLILTRGGHVKLVDFGMSSTPTARRRRAGTPDFRAPELGGGFPPSRATDIYSLAATAFTLFTGSPPSGTLPTWERIDDVNASELEATLRRGLATDPERRPLTAGEFVERLQTGWATTLPTGVMTFCLSDIEGSTAIWDTQPAAMASALVRHDELIAEAVEARGGRFLKSMGEGDSTVSVFDAAANAIEAAIAITEAVATEAWPGDITLRLRFGLHTGEAERRGTDYFGPTLNLAARLRAQADGGQIFCSSTTTELVAGHLPPGHRLIDLGPHRLKGISVPERVFALSGPAIAAPFASTECPYRGLLSFEASDRELFFGREQILTEILGRIAPGRLIAIVGASGSGKSSVLRAGVVAAVRDGDVAGCHHAVVVTPGTLCEPPDRADAQTVLLVDQFEELFTLCRDPARQSAFVDALLAHAGPAVIALRADFYGELTAHPLLARAVTDNQVLLGPMREDELRRAVIEPARIAGLKLESGLVDVTVGDVAGQPGALPLLSHALRATWELRDGRTLTLDGYRETGGVESAIARTADHIVDDTPADQQPILRNLFLRLTDIGDGVQETRRRVSVADLVPEGGTACDVDAMIERLVDARLLTIDDGAAEVAHEALIREWPRLRAWLDEDRAGLRLHRRLGDAAQLWDAGGREPTDLYRGARLDAAHEWADNHHGELNALERAFLDSSTAQHDADAKRQQRANRRLRLLLGGTAIALVLALIGGSLALRASRTARAQTREANIQRLVGQSGALLDTKRDLGLLLAVEAHRRNDRLDTRGALLTALVHEPSFLGYIRQGNSDASTAVFLNNHELLIGYVNGTLRRVDIATRRPIGPTLRPYPTTIAETRVTPDGRYVMAWTITPTQSRIAMLDLATGRHVHEFTPDQRIANFEISPDGRYLAAGGLVQAPEQSKAFVWSLASGHLVRTLAGDPSRQTVQNNDGPNYTAVAFSSTGLLAVGSKASTITLLNARTFAEVGKLQGVPNIVDFALAFSPDGTRLVSGDLHAQRLMAWNVITRRPVWPKAAHAEVNGPAVAITRTNDVLYAKQSGETITLDGNTGQPTGSPVSLQGGSVCELKISPDGNTLAVTDCNSPIVALFALDGRSTIGPIASTTDGLGGYSPNGQLLWTIGNTGITIRNARTFQALYHLPPNITSMDFSTDSQYALVVNQDGRAGRYDYRTNQFTGPARRIRTDQPGTSAVDPTTGHLALGYDDGAVLVIDANGNRVEPRDIAPNQLRGQIHGLSFSPDSRRLAVAAQDENTLIFDTHTGRRVGPPIPRAPNARYSPDGKLLVAAAFDGTLAFYDASTLKPNGLPISASRAWVASLTFSRDSHLLAAVALDGTTRLFDVQSRQQIGAPLASSRYGPAVLRPDGLALATQIDLKSNDPNNIPSITQVWTLDPTTWQQAACQEAGRNLTQAESTKYVDGTYHTTCPQWPADP